jgi:hypothetical protein
MTNQLKLVRKDTIKRNLTIVTAFSAISFAVALTFAPLPAAANPNHDGDSANHESDETCTDHEGMSAEDHEKGHKEGAYDCDMDGDHDDGENSDHQH